MARTVREASLATRSARLRLAVQTKPYWRAIEQGLHLGYRRRTTGGTWIARRRDERGQYREAKLGLADDLQGANGATILDFSQAQRSARSWCTQQERVASGLAVPAGPYTVAQAMADYLADYRGRGGKAAESVESVSRQNILPELGRMRVVKLTTRQISDWHRAVAERPRNRRSRRDGTANVAAAFDRHDPEAVRRRRASANRVLTYLKAALNHAWRSGVVPSDDAWRRVKPFKSVEAPVIRYLSHDEIARLLNAAWGAFRDLVHGALLTGCRYGELCQLRVSDYNPDVGTLTIRAGKGGGVRHVTLTGEGPELIEGLIAGRSPGGPLFLREEGRSWKRCEQLRPMSEACKRAGIAPAAGFHILRHTHASILAMRAVPMAVIARQLGPRTHA